MESDMPAKRWVDGDSDTVKTEALEDEWQEVLPRRPDVGGPSSSWTQGQGPSQSMSLSPWPGPLAIRPSSYNGQGTLAKRTTPSSAFQPLESPTPTKRPRSSLQEYDPCSPGFSPLALSVSSFEAPSNAKPPRRKDLARKKSLKRLKHRERIDVIIVCALVVEQNAILALFDEHTDINYYGKANGDDNAYSFGAIQEHKVVLVHMPHMGKSSAAAAVAHCKASFPFARLALLIGVCGGVPTNLDGKEIVLGDVVISNGLVAYDFGKKYPGTEGFQRKDNPLDNPRKPPAEVQGFLAKLTGVWGRQRLEEKTLKHLETLREDENLGYTTIYPGVTEDRLFEPTYRHKHREPFFCATCAETEGKPGSVCVDACAANCEELNCDLSKLVLRRRHDAICRYMINEFVIPPPAIHVGTFASGDTVMKSGEDRDLIAKREGILAFEMEGAGIWDRFPCFIIKGVCDYADSHKNKEWQLYAAATAAACTKAFLEDWAVREDI